MTGRKASVERHRDWLRQVGASPAVARLIGQPADNGTGLALLLLQWGIIVATAAIAAQVRAWPVTVCAVLLIGTRQHALLVLMHDAAHGLLCHSRRINDTAAAMLAAFPLFMSVSGYRAHHMAHHLLLNTAQDPDIADAHPPASVSQLRKLLARDVCGLSSLKSLRSIDSFGIGALWRTPVERARGERALFVAFAALAVAVTAWAPVEVFLYWVAPMVFVLPLLLRMRSLGEHAGLLGAPNGMDARTITPRWWERLSISPFSINRHWEHHLFPKIPCYRLERLASALRETVPEGHIHETYGYVFGPHSVWAELFAPQRSPR